MQNISEYETAYQAAERLGVTPRTVQKWVSEGQIQGAVRHGKSWLIPKGAVRVCEQKTVLLMNRQSLVS